MRIIYRHDSHRVFRIEFESLIADLASINSIYHYKSIKYAIDIISIILEEFVLLVTLQKT